MNYALKIPGDGETLVDEVAAVTGGSDPLRLRAAPSSGLFSGISTAKSKKSRPQQEAQGSVGNSTEFQRIMALPRRVLDLNNVEDVTPLVARPGGTMRLHPIQSAALVDAALMNGLLAPIGVGHGKTLITLLLPIALDSEKTVLLVPSKVRRQLEREIGTIYNKHFFIPLDRITIVAYEDLSSQTNADILERLEPDLIVADECHCLRYSRAARTKRFLRFMVDHPATRFCGLSGTITDKSIKDYAHLLELALRKCSPAPRGYREVTDWSGALDVKPDYVMAPGVLKQFCKPGESVRSGYRRRLVETPGVVATKEGSLGTSLIIQRINVKLPDKVAELRNEVRKTWSIDGDEFDDILRLVTVMRQLSCGFYYRWAWPGGKPDLDWLEARSAWNRAVREKLKHARPRLDSPGLLAKAAERWYQGKTPSPRSPIWECDEWVIWREECEKPEPPKETVWVDDFLCRDALRRAEKAGAPTIIWYEHVAIGERLGQISGLPVYGEGTDASDTRDQILIASRRVQGITKNLQHYANNIFTTLPGSAKDVEQSIGRTHRQGQEADTVTVEWYGHTDELRGLMAKVIEEAMYQQETTGQSQKVLYATRID